MDELAIVDEAAPERLFYQAHVFVCTNMREPGHRRGCCQEKGAEELRNYMKKRARALGIEGTRINSAGCLDRCELGPCMVIYPEGVWYSYRDEHDIDEILTSHLLEGRVVDRLTLRPDQEPPSLLPLRPPSGGRGSG